MTVPSQPTEGPWHAYVDESQSIRSTDPDTYLLAAALCPPADLDTTRDMMRKLLLKGQRKVHWHDESDKRRREIIEVVARLPVDHIVVIREGRPGERPERRRRHCLERLCYELDHRGVTKVTLESRGPADDKRDRAMLGALRAKRVVSGALRLHHAPGPGEALLWLPDAVCGAVTRARAGDTTFTETVMSQMTIITITAGN